LALSVAVMLRALQQQTQHRHSHYRKENIMPNYKGRGAQPIHPGLTIKGVLIGKIPLATGDLVTEASITDIHNAYRELLWQVNTLRPKSRKLRGMRYPSFYALFRLARYLGLVEFVRDEPMLFPPPKGHLYSLRKNAEMEVVVSTRRIYRLTDKGREAEQSWQNLHRAWRYSRSIPSS